MNPCCLSCLCLLPRGSSLSLSLSLFFRPRFNVQPLFSRSKFFWFAGKYAKNDLFSIPDVWPFFNTSNVTGPLSLSLSGFRDNSSPLKECRLFNTASAFSPKSQKGEHTPSYSRLVFLFCLSLLFFFFLRSIYLRFVLLFKSTIFVSQSMGNWGTDT